MNQLTKKEKNLKDSIKLFHQVYDILERNSAHYTMPDGLLERIEYQIKKLEEEGF